VQGQRIAFDTVNGAQRRVAAPFAMRQIPTETDSELGEFGFGSKGLVDQPGRYKQRDTITVVLAAVV
jgi:hypothetical protein